MKEFLKDKIHIVILSVSLFVWLITCTINSLSVVFTDINERPVLSYSFLLLIVSFSYTVYRNWDNGGKESLKVVSKCKTCGNKNKK